MNDGLELELRYRLMKLLSGKGNLTQRDMARHIGVSLGKVNDFISDLSRRGLVLIQHIRQPGKRVKYMYLLTSAGVEEKARLASNFLKTRIHEYELIRKQIRELVDEVAPAEESDPEETEKPVSV
jgi:EPS-associated MarR family transcriptional regulator